MRRRRGRETLASQGSRSQSLLELYREGVSSDDEQTGSETALFNTELGKHHITNETFLDYHYHFYNIWAMMSTNSRDLSFLSDHFSSLSPSYQYSTVLYYNTIE